MASRADKMAENRLKLIQAARKSFAENGYAQASMDELTAKAGLTRGALYHNFGDKRGLLAAVVEQIDGEMARRAKKIGARESDAWSSLLAEGVAYIEMSLDPEVRRTVLLDGPAYLGDPSKWPSQDSCLSATRLIVDELIASGSFKPLDADAVSRLLNGAALNAALWVAASDVPVDSLPAAIAAFRAMATGFLTSTAPSALSSR